MRIAILSDIHANLEALQATLARIRQEGTDAVVCLGDIVGYHTDPAEVIGLLRQAGALCIAGNHDRAVAGQISTDGFSSVAARAVRWTRDRLDADDLQFLAGLPLKAAVGSHLVTVHGALHLDQGCELERLDSGAKRRQSVRALADHPSGAAVCAFGHTHRAGIYEWDEAGGEVLHGSEVEIRPGRRYLVNPGTVGEPRGYDRRASYALFDTDRRTISLRRVRYDVAAAMAKTRKAGLAPRLAALPAPVRSHLHRMLRSVCLQSLPGLILPPRRGPT